MTDQSLSDSVQMLRNDLARSYPDRVQYDMASTTIDRLDSLLAASCPCLQDEGGIEVKPGCPEHDPRPAHVEITDELIESIARTEYVAAGLYWSKAGKYERAAALARTRRTVVAALPHLASRPLLDREAVRATLQSVWQQRSAAMVAASPADHCSILADAVMDLTRPMPTREQIAQAVAKAGIGSYRAIVTAAVMALLNGSQS